MNGDYVALAARIRTELEDLELVVKMTTGDLMTFADLLEQLAAHDD